MVKLARGKVRTEYKYKLDPRKYAEFLKKYDKNQGVFDLILKKNYMKMIRSTIQGNTYLVYSREYPTVKEALNTDETKSVVLWVMDKLTKIDKIINEFEE